ncbi:MAG: ATP-dependent DNA ligase [Candidatus Helarchaeota archaeon]
MQYGVLAQAYEALESTSKRLEMTEILVKLFNKTPKEILDKVIFLTQGRLHPSWFNLPVIGIAEKSAIKAVSRATTVNEKKIANKVKEIGDLGSAFKKILKIKINQKSLLDFGIKKQSTAPLSVELVYSTLDKIANAAGPGSNESKIKLLAELLRNADAIEGKWILRTVLGKLRFGIADQTILDALALAFTGSKENKQIIERGYNIYPNLGKIAKRLAENGLNSIKSMKIEIFVPVRMMLAQRLSSIEDILEKLGGKCACEYKYDGERIQIHKSDGKIELFSRNLENPTSQYPDVRDLIQQIPTKQFVVEGEIVAVNPETGELKPFQELMHRRRKYRVKEAQQDYPVNLFLFDILKKDDKDLIDEPYLIRRKYLEELKIINNQIKLSTLMISDNKSEIEKFFQTSIESGCEGIIAKSIQKESIYSAGARGWLWIKFKESYQSKMIDTIDVVILAAYMGRGKRAQTYGALLCGVLDDSDGSIQSICKLGSGFTDEDLSDLIQKFETVKRDTRPSQVKILIKPDPDIWFEPRFVAEIMGDEITLSPTHTAGLDKIKPNFGLAIRFPRFIRWREDKSLNDITTTDEIVEMYKRQKKTS